MISLISSLAPGTAFRLHGEALTGRVVRVGQGAVSVRLAGSTRDVAFVDGQGEEHRFTASQGRVVEWSPFTLVEIEDSPADGPAALSGGGPGDFQPAPGLVVPAPTTPGGDSEIGAAVGAGGQVIERPADHEEAR